MKFYNKPAFSLVTMVFLLGVSGQASAQMNQPYMPMMNNGQMPSMGQYPMPMHPMMQQRYQQSRRQETTPEQQSAPEKTPEPAKTETAATDQPDRKQGHYCHHKGKHSGKGDKMKRMQQRQEAMQQHMQRMETHLANIESLLRQMVENR